AGPMNTVIRTGGRTDVLPVLRLWTAAGAQPSHTDNVAGLEALLAHDPDALMVAEDGPAVVGSVIAAWDGWRGSIYRLAVAPSHRRTGLAGRLLRRGEERLSDIGALRLQAVVVGTDAPATGFWGASGWEQQHDRLRFVRG
ncbi:MAG TPA: GNAT family N-acetyltransferase, partial [Acidimicrobiales bacterium]|nr:GNAT family N-acetyltransferase [Acidimicrobiales bacterium]